MERTERGKPRVHRPLARRSLAWIAATVVVLAAAAVQAGPVSGPSASSAPRTAPPASSPCAACHGPAGEGNAAAGFPRLAGLPAAYLVAQIDAMASGMRQSAVMGPLARSLSETQRLQLAAFYAALPRARASGAPDVAATSDNPLALRGRWSEDIPACVRCHGERGSGVGSAFPPLAAQPALYLANQLRAWKQGTRRGDPLGLMQGIAKRLSEEDIRSVSDYFAAQQPTAIKGGPKP